MRAVAIALLCASCASPPATGAAWPEADALFHSDPNWLGADAAYSIDLGAARVLWLFGDSFVATSDAHLRSESKLPRNTVAIQQGYDPSQATITFYWATNGGVPDSFFPQDGADWFWPAQGIRLGDSLLIFLSRIAASSGGLGFAAAGWTAVAVDNPDADPSQWTWTDLAPPANSFGVTFGTAALDDGAWLYVYGAEDAGEHATHLLRFADSDARAGDLSKPEWFANGNWVAQSALTSLPAALFGDGSTEFSVTANAKGLTEVQSIGFGATTIGLRTAPSFTGAWNSLQSVYTPPESGRDGVLVYAGKAHGELSGADLIATYASNDTDFTTLVADTSLYYPRFVKLTIAGSRP